MIDVLIVGAGLTASIIAASLRRKRVVVIDTSPCLGGLLHDLCVRDTYIPQRGTWFLDGNEEALGILDAHMRFSRVLHNPTGVNAFYPQGGWTAACRHLFGGAEVILGAEPDHWVSLVNQSKRVVYTGRLDLLPWPTLDSRLLIGSEMAAPNQPYWLPWYGLRSQQMLSTAQDQQPITTMGADTRYFHRKLTGGDSDLMTMERMVDCTFMPRLCPSPAGPLVTPETSRKADRLKAMLAGQYPQIRLAGHLGTFQTMDIGQTVCSAYVLAQTLAG